MALPPHGYAEVMLEKAREGKTEEMAAMMFGYGGNWPFGKSV
jgi:hypothetical protein